MTARTVSVLGAGSTSRRNVDALLDDAHSAVPITAVRVAGTEKHFTDAARFVADWALANGVHLSFGLDSGGEIDRTDYADVATIKVPDMVEHLTHGVDEVFLAYDDTSDEAEELMDEIVRSATAAGAEVFDLVDGLWGPLKVDGSDDTTEAPIEPQQPTEAPAVLFEQPDEAQALHVANPERTQVEEVPSSPQPPSGQVLPKLNKYEEIGRHVAKIFELLAA